MKCPTCANQTPEDWKWLHWADKDLRDAVRQVKEDDIEVFGRMRMEGTLVARPWVALAWMRCGNKACQELVVVVHERFAKYGGMVPIQTNQEWSAYPRVGAERPVDPRVQDPYRLDFAEAAAIRDRSPRMSAVMSRRILADLLEQYAGLKDWELGERVRKFVNDTKHPQSIRDNLQHFAKIGDFGAHTKKDDQDVVIVVTTDEAEWTLDLVERLFDYFIVTPSKDAELRTRFDKKIKDAGDKPIAPPPDKKRT